MALLIVIGLALALMAWWLAEPWMRSLRRARLRLQPFPAPWRRILRRRVPAVARLPVPLQLRLKGLIQVFLAEKPIIGCAGLVVTDEMRVTLAAQACLPLLGRPRGYYPELRQVLLYPGAFVVNRPVNAPGGVVQDQRRALAGESWAQGQVLLSWDDVRAGAADPSDGQNVVVHEFAHQLDQVKGVATGAPPLPTAAAQARWQAVMQTAYDGLRARQAHGGTGVLGDYAATDPAEFFAVASECFFERSLDLQAEWPEVYAELSAFYALNPAAWA